MTELSYQTIYEILGPTLPDNWYKLVFYAGYGDENYSMKYYVEDGNGKYIDCFSLDFPEEQIIRLFIKIDKEIAPVRQQLSVKNQWNVLTLIVSSDGEFSVDYDYSDVSEDYISYFAEWEKKYLI